MLFNLIPKSQNFCLQTYDGFSKKHSHIDRKPSEEILYCSCLILGQSTCLLPVTRLIDILWEITGKLYAGNRAETVTDLAVSDEVVMIGRKASVYECTTAIKTIKIRALANHCSSTLFECMYRQ